MLTIVYSWSTVGFWVQVGGQGTVGTSTGSGSSAQQQAARKVTRMCMTVATTFTVTWLPMQLNRFVLMYGNSQHAVMMLDILETIAYVNSCVNPIVYALMWRPFRLSLIQVRRTCLRRWITHADDSRGIWGIAFVCVYLCVSLCQFVRMIEPKRLKLQSPTCNGDNPSWVLATHVILGQRSRSQVHKVQKYI